jgi:hypothetical protein
VPLRVLAFLELARVIRPGGWLLCSFHVSPADHSPGDVRHRDSWWEQSVDLDGHFLDPTEVTDARMPSSPPIQRISCASWWSAGSAFESKPCETDPDVPADGGLEGVRGPAPLGGTRSEASLHWRKVTNLGRKRPWFVGS